MADNASIARPYAKAVFDLATESSNQDDWATSLESLAAIAQDEEFGKAVNSPQVTAEQLEGLVLGVLGKKIPTGGDNFIKLLAQNGRLESLPEVQQQYALLLAESRKSCLLYTSPSPRDRG